MRKPMNFRSTTIPSASGTLFVIDSTWLWPLGAGVAARGLTEPTTTPGPYRGMWAGKPLIIITVDNGDQPVDWYQDGLLGASGVAADWEPESTGTGTLAINDRTPFEWRPQANDFRMRLVMGGTPTSELVVHGSIFWDTRG